MLTQFFAFLAQAAIAPNAPLLEIPREFWGEYNEVLSDCGTGNNDSRLRISWNTVHFYESSGELKELLRQDDGSIVVIAEHNGEGQTWQSVYQLRLSEDRNTLTVVYPQTIDMAQFSSDRKRCTR